jgi:copper chaperone
MNILKFKTNINCGGCVARVTPFLDKQDGIDFWEVDTESEDKILTVQGNGVSSEDIRTTLNKIGFKAESLH